MSLIADGLMIVAGLTAGLYCLVLSRRLRQLSDSGQGIGAQIRALTEAIAETRQAVAEARRGADDSAARLGREIRKAEGMVAELRAAIAAAESAPQAVPPEPDFLRGPEARPEPRPEARPEPRPGQAGAAMPWDESSSLGADAPGPRRSAAFETVFDDFGELDDAPEGAGGAPGPVTSAPVAARLPMDGGRGRGASDAVPRPVTSAASRPAAGAMFDMPEGTGLELHGPEIGGLLGAVSGFAAPDEMMRPRATVEAEVPGELRGEMQDGIQSGALAAARMNGAARADGVLRVERVSL